MTSRLLFASGVITTSLSTDVRAMFSSPIVIQKQSEIAYTVLLFVMLIGSAQAFPSRPMLIDEKNRTIIFHNQPCKPVDSQQLSLRMGEFFDSSRMALDESTVKRSISRALSQEAADRDDDSDNDDEEFSDDSEFSEVDSDSENSKQSKQIKIHKFTENPSHPLYSESQMYMRRKRDADLEEDDIDGNNVDAFKSKYQRLMESKAMKKQFKRFIRKSKKLKKVKKLPWTCKMRNVWLSMESGYFPPYIQSATCSSKKCFFKLNECIPKKYAIKILRRDPNRCNPVPTFGLNTTYEEKWYFDIYHVTVWCECGNSTKKKRRRKNGKKSRP